MVFALSDLEKDNMTKVAEALDVAIATLLLPDKKDTATDKVKTATMLFASSVGMNTDYVGSLLKGRDFSLVA